MLIVIQFLELNRTLASLFIISLYPSLYLEIMVTVYKYSFLSLLFEKQVREASSSRKKQVAHSEQCLLFEL